MVWELTAYNTDSRYPNDIRYRGYTSSQKVADLFNRIPKIQFSDSGHGIVFQAREHKGKRKPVVTDLCEYVGEETLKLKVGEHPEFGRDVPKQDDRITQLESTNKELVTALVSALGSEKSSECRADHHGYCQTHNLQPINECWVKLSEDALAKAKVTRL